MTQTVTDAPSTGGTEFGWSYISNYKACPMRWFNRYHRPNKEGGLGVAPMKTASPLLIGSGTHEGLAAWYRSGWRDGEDTGHRNLDRALDAAEAHFATRRDEFEDESAYDDGLAMVRKLLTGYHDWYGEGGPEQEYPHYKVLGDPETGEPLIEVEFRVPLGQGYVFTTRLDTVVSLQQFAYDLEHKSWAAQGVSAGFDRFGIDGQGTGQIFALKDRYPELSVAGIIVNALVKNRGARSNKPPFERNITGRTEQDIEKFKLDTARTLAQMDAALEEFRHLVQGGLSVNEAANVVFDASPPSVVCRGFSRCEYYAPCKSRGYEQSLFDSNYRAPKPRPGDEESSDD